MRWIAIAVVVVAVVVVGCKKQKAAVESTPAAPDAAPPPGPFTTVVIDGASGSAFFAPDQQSFWVQNNDGDAFVRYGLDGKERELIALEDKLEEASLWIRTTTSRRPVSPDGKRILESRTEVDRDGHSAFLVDLVAHTETPLPVEEYADVEYLADGRLLVVDLGDADSRPSGILDPATGTRAPLCAGVKALDDVDVTADGKGLVVSGPDEVFLADLGCTKVRKLVAGDRVMVLGSPHGTAWLASVYRDGDVWDLRVVEPAPERTIGPANLTTAAWLDDDVFVFIDDGVAKWARASSAAAPAPVSTPPAGCSDDWASGAPGGGVVAIARGCGEGLGAMVVVTPR